MASISTAKKEMRRRIKKILAGVSADSVASQSSLATERLLALPEYQAARRVSVYLSMPAGEMMTAAIVRDAFRRGKQVFVPYIYKLAGSAETKPSSIMEMLALRSIEDYESLQPDGWGIPTLDASSLAGRENCLGGDGLLGEDGALHGDDCGLDFIVVPGMAFDDGRRRLGHGKGYYDRFINRYRSSAGKGKMPYLAAFCLAEQVLQPPEEVPVGEYDNLVDSLVVGDGRVVRS
ncbi:5-formyltetrahydrofolate cyclo-ligase [Nannizzia gypsea CBS 118893]|uniref:5-formyltetrahydrofolate cyclo-ligase n=1 Tax=Arthroderma gypseum (strain ATCC MYA-4604 / CBS 118893) TaxID=535722 RepID=E4V3J9_ARTGP|nr:5-formyltetrahydrofolate cyclo-ligase [Nannizzia gypsea CBS 118893]EFR04573.1 5-formyltetrahydrofolate cyclo-ligase [Nannizzia gypsea CBS 118893]